ncbi:MAG: hypothetical protein ACLPX5_16745 [Dissulfurispiraceae bacterium]
MVKKRVQTSPRHRKIWQKKKKKDQHIVSMNKEEREEMWDDVYVKEEGIVLEFDSESNVGKIKSLHDSSVYNIETLVN